LAGIKTDLFDRRLPEHRGVHQQLQQPADHGERFDAGLCPDHQNAPRRIRGFEVER
jgi:hypothetical protein